jgi:hypothetical protein
VADLSPISYEYGRSSPMIACAWCGGPLVHFAGRPEFHDIPDGNPAPMRHGEWLGALMWCENCPEGQHSLMVLSANRGNVYVETLPVIESGGRHVVVAPELVEAFRTSAPVLDGDDDPDWPWFEE